MAALCIPKPLTKHTGYCSWLLAFFFFFPTEACTPRARAPQQQMPPQRGVAPTPATREKPTRSNEDATQAKKRKEFGLCLWFLEGDSKPSEFLE